MSTTTDYDSFFFLHVVSNLRHPRRLRLKEKETEPPTSLLPSPQPQTTMKGERDREATGHRVLWKDKGRKREDSNDFFSNWCFPNRIPWVFFQVLINNNDSICSHHASHVFLQVISSQSLISLVYFLLELGFIVVLSVSTT